MIFILSTERAGSTLLRVLLDSHPQVAAPGELGLGDLCHRLLIILTRTLGQTESPASPLSTDLWLAGVAPQGEAAAKVLAETRALVDGILSRYAQACGKERWCNKTPSDLPYAELLRLLFPEARFLCLHRHGYDVVASCLEVSRYGYMRELAPYVMSSPSNTVAAMMRSWVEKTEQILQFESYWSQQCMRLRYEDLVSQPQSTLEGVLRFLDLRPCPDLHTSALQHSHHKGGGDPRIWTTEGLESDRIGAGKKLPKALLPRALADQAATLLDKLGYPVTC